MNIKKQLQDMLDTQKEKRQWINDALRSNEKGIINCKREIKVFEDGIEKLNKYIDENDKDIQKIESVINLVKTEVA